MPAVTSKKKRAAVASAMLDMDDYWSANFIELGLNDLNYSDLFFQMWLRQGQALGKTGLYDFMPGISRRTAVKYVQELIDRKLLLEECAEDDKRVKYISLSKEIVTRLERYLDFAYERVNRMA
ncbi:MAG: MarR family transcriptional regulator [Verrucomicrobiaceae bacterium]|nr:MarR family transcriptional regulator [Verrucomicrobiaceae bacterium]